MTISISHKALKDRPMKDWALMYAGVGWRVFPVYEVMDLGEAGWICACGEGAACGRPGKHPRTRDGLNEATTDRVTIEGWWNRWPHANVGIATGRASGITVVDADASDGKPGVVNLTALSVRGGGMPSTPIVNTGGGGMHLFFLWNERLKTGTNVIAEAIDVRSDGGYVIAPPSRHKSGKIYEWRGDNADPITVPDWLLQSRESGETEAKKRGRKRSQPGFKLEKLESMLATLDPDDRDLWLQTGVILGRLYVGSGLEHDAWAVYETWSARTAKFDEDRAGNLARMREMYYERSQEAPRTGGKSLGVGTIIAAAKEAGWNPFGDRIRIQWELGNEGAITEGLVQALTERKENTFFNVMGEVRDVLKTEIPILRMKAAAHARGEKCPETLLVRRTTTHGLILAMAEAAVLETTDAQGVPQAVAIPEKLGTMILRQRAPMFPTLTGIAEWPMVGANGEIIVGQQGYDNATGLYFDIDRGIKISPMSAEAGADWLLRELLADFPFDTEQDAAAALGMLIAFMQRPLMKTCPAFGIVAPQPKSGKSTLVEVASLAIHGHPIASHAFAGDDEDELRKAIHSLMLAKIPAVLFDNVGRGRTVDSDHLAKLLTSEVSTDRTLGASETRKEINTLLVAFTGNNIAFAHDMASRVVQIKLNAKTSNPMTRSFKHRDVRSWAHAQRSATLSALIALVKAGRSQPELGGTPSRFDEFDEQIVKPVFAATGVDIRSTLDAGNEADSEEESELRDALKLISRWQQKWRKEMNGERWKMTELMAAIDGKTFDESGLKIIARATNNPKLWEADPARAIGYLLRSLNGDHKFEPLLLSGKLDTNEKVMKWFVKGAEDVAQPRADGGF